MEWVSTSGRTRTVKGRGGRPCGSCLAAFEDGTMAVLLGTGRSWGKASKAPGDVSEKLGCFPGG